MEELTKGLCKDCWQYQCHGMCPYNMETALTENEEEALFYEDVVTCDNYDSDGGLIT